MAKKGINDEFYTPAETIINELKWYGYDGYFKGKTIDVRGIVDYYDGGYQIKLFTLSDVQTD